MMCNCIPELLNCIPEMLLSAHIDGRDIRTQPKQTNRFHFIVVISLYNFSKIMMFREQWQLMHLLANSAEFP